MFTDLSGQTIGIFKVISFEGFIKNSRQGEASFLVECLKCGDIQSRVRQRIRADNKACFNLECKWKANSEAALARSSSHGDSYTSLWHIHQAMKNRCRPSVKNYGARGITICEEWSVPSLGYLTFRKWAVSNGYEEGLSIERTDPDGNYCPENCEWIPKDKQSRNRRTTVWLEVDGERMTLSEALIKYRVDWKVYKRRMKHGYSSEEALKLPSDWHRKEGSPWRNAKLGNRNRSKKKG